MYLVYEKLLLFFNNSTGSVYFQPCSLLGRLLNIWSMVLIKTVLFSLEYYT